MTRSPHATLQSDPNAEGWSPPERPEAVGASVERLGALEESLAHRERTALAHHRLLLERWTRLRDDGATPPNEQAVAASLARREELVRARESALATHERALASLELALDRAVLSADGLTGELSVRLLESLAREVDGLTLGRVDRSVRRALGLPSSDPSPLPSIDRGVAEEEATLFDGWTADLTPPPHGPPDASPRVSGPDPAPSPTGLSPPQPPGSTEDDGAELAAPPPAPALTPDPTPPGLEVEREDAAELAGLDESALAALLDDSDTAFEFESGDVAHLPEFESTSSATEEDSASASVHSSLPHETLATDTDRGEPAGQATSLDETTLAALLEGFDLPESPSPLPSLEDDAPGWYAAGTGDGDADSSAAEETEASVALEFEPGDDAPADESADVDPADDDPAQDDPLEGLFEAVSVGVADDPTGGHPAAENQPLEEWPDAWVDDGPEALTLPPSGDAPDDDESIGADGVDGLDTPSESGTPEPAGDTAGSLLSGFPDISALGFDFDDEPESDEPNPAGRDAASAAILPPGDGVEPSSDLDWLDSVFDEAETESRRAAQQRSSTLDPEDSGSAFATDSVPPTPGQDPFSAEVERWTSNQGSGVTDEIEDPIMALESAIARAAVDEPAPGVVGGSSSTRPRGETSEAAVASDYQRFGEQLAGLIPAREANSLEEALASARAPSSTPREGAAGRDPLDDLLGRFDAASEQLDEESQSARIEEVDPWRELDALVPVPPAPLSELDSLSSATLAAIVGPLRPNSRPALDSAEGNLDGLSDDWLPPIVGYDVEGVEKPAPIATPAVARIPAPPRYPSTIGAAEVLGVGDPDATRADESWDAMFGARPDAGGLLGELDETPDPWSQLDLASRRSLPRSRSHRAPAPTVADLTIQRDVDERGAPLQRNDPVAHRAPRAHLAVKVGIEHGNHFFTGFSGNISSGGLFVATHQLLEIGSQLELFFEMPDGHSVSVLGEVRWVRAFDPGTVEGQPGMGLRFLNLSHDDRVLLDRYIEQHETIFYD